MSLVQNPQEDEIKRLEAKAADKLWPQTAKDVFSREIAKLKDESPDGGVWCQPELC